MNKSLGLFLKRNVSGLITLVAGILFLFMRLAFPDYVSGNVADVLLMIALPLLVINYLVVFKIEETNSLIDNVKEEIFHTIGYKLKLFNKDTCDNYYVNMLSKSNSILDLTWAETNSRNSNLDENVINSLDVIQEYKEIFIFKVKGKYRKDRLLRLKFIYDKIKSNTSKTKINYSCAYYDETSFERLQFIIFDEKEALFSSSYYQRCSIQEPSLISILMKYYHQSWIDATLLINEGKIEDEAKITELISFLNEK